LTLKKHNRRRFLQLAATGAGLSLVYLWDKMMGNRLMTTLHQKITLPLIHRLVSFYGDYIVVNQKQHVKVFSSHCTHLGCIIDEVENGKLICPCHGSEFNLEGEAVKGPAYKPLGSVPFRENDNGQQIIIQPSDT